MINHVVYSNTICDPSRNEKKIFLDHLNIFKFILRFLYFVLSVDNIIIIF